MNFAQVKKIAGILVTPRVDARTQAARIDFMEENVMLPVKLFIIGFLYYILYTSGAFPGEMTVGEGMRVGESSISITIDAMRKVFWVYAIVTVVGALFLVNMHRIPLGLVQWVVCLINLVDALFLASLTVLTGVMKEVTYWVFLFLIGRNTVSVPVAWLQIPLNILTIASFVVAGVYDKALIDVDFTRLNEGGVVTAKGYYEALTVRIALLLVWTACCHVFQILMEHQREAQDELREHIVRHEQMQTAGRLAAEIAHRIKNPLAIINNAAFTAQRALPEGKAGSQKQLQLIREEVEKCDRILTELMGYAQLAEGKIEKIDVVEQIEMGIDQVFPPGAKYNVTIHREFDPGVPDLQMQRGHLRDIIVNLLLNAREALKGQGNVWISLKSDSNYTVTLAIRDDGPGIPPDKHERIFESYYTGKEKGTGLGLAIVKHNAEIYGGFVAIHSELGKGAEFVVQISAKTMMRLRR